MSEAAAGLHVLIVGAGGMIGRKLTDRLAGGGSLGTAAIRRLTLADLTPPPRPDGTAGSAGVAVDRVGVDLTERGTAARLVAERPDVIFHLAAVVSGEAEEDLDKGYAVNLDATRWLFEAVRDEATGKPYRPRLVYASSIAVFGPPFPDRIGDDFLAAPATSYGTQKAMGELLLSDHSRRGILDGIALRLPTICVRPGTPNRAASGFFSNILREPLAGKPAVLPVDDSVRHWFASPRSAVGFLEHAATLDTALLGQRRALNMPGLSATVADQLEALRRVGGQAAVDLVRHEPDPRIAAMVGSWPRDFDAARARELGFVAETSFDDIVRAHVEDELGGQLATAGG